MDIFYDLTELYTSAREKLRFYGVARVVAEVAFDLHGINEDIRFVVYDENYNRFFEVRPRFGSSADNGLVTLGIPYHSVPHRLRSRSHPGVCNQILTALVNSLLRPINRLRLQKISDILVPIELKSAFLISTGFPRKIDAYLPLIKASGSVKLCVLVHDVMPLHDYGESPSSFQREFREALCRVINQASHVISNSHNTQTDIKLMIERGLLPPLPAHSIVQLAHECRASTENHTISLPNRPYVIAVGVTPGRKNLEVILDAQALDLQMNRVPPLLIISGVNRHRGFSTVFQGTRKHLLEHVQFVNNPSQEDLIYLYKNALATVVASKYEGWDCLWVKVFGFQPRPYLRMRRPCQRWVRI